MVASWGRLTVRVRDYGSKPQSSGQCTEVPCGWPRSNAGVTSFWILGVWCLSATARQRMADLPVMPEWINHPAQAPPIRFLHGDDLSSTRRQCLREHRVWIGHGQDHSGRSTAQRLWTEVAMLRGLVTQPKLRTVNR